MAKHPVPKKRQATTRSKKRYSVFVLKKQKQLRPFLDVKPCPTCGQLTILSLTCPNCGHYRKKKVFDREAEVTKKITKVKA